MSNTTLPIEIQYRREAITSKVDNTVQLICEIEARNTLQDSYRLDRHSIWPSPSIGRGPWKERGLNVRSKQHSMSYRHEPATKLVF